MKHCIHSLGTRAWGRFGVLLLGILFACGGGPEARAATKAWLGNAANNLWSTASNWSPAGVPQDGDALTFPGGSFYTDSQNDLSNLRVHSILFSGAGGGYSIAGNLIQLESDITDNHTGLRNRVRCYVQFVNGGGFFTTAGAGELEVNGDVILSGGGELALFCGTAPLIVSGSILGQGSVIKHGAKSLTLSGNYPNDFSGPLTIREGTNFLAKAAGVTAVSGNLIIGHRDDFTYGQVILQSPNQIADTITNTINHGGIDLNGWDEALGPIHFYDGDIRTGTATLTLLAPVRQRSWIYVRECSIKGTVYAPGDLTFELDDDDGLLVWANVTGSGGLVQNGHGLLTLIGTNTFAGPVTVNGGGLTVGTYLSLGSGSQVTLNGGGLELYAFSGSAGALGAINKQLTVTTASSWFTASGGDWIWGGNIQLNFTGLLSCTAGPFSSAALRLFGSIQGAGGVWFGGDQIELLGNNTFTGPTVAACALLSINNGNGRPFSDSLLVGGDFRVTDRYLHFGVNFYTNATAELRWFSSPVTTHPNVTLLDNALVNLNGRTKQINQLIFNGGHVTTGAGRLYANSITSNPVNVTAVIDGNLTPVGSTLVLDIADGPATPDLAINATISDLAGVSGLTKQGAGELLLPVANAYDGLTTIAGGVLHIQNNSSLGTTGQGTTVLEGGTLRVEFVAALSEPLTLRGAGRYGTEGALNLLPATGGNPPITLADAASVRVDSSFAILSGIISGPGSFAKLGAGTLQLGGGSGGANTFTGDTIVNEGTLVLFKPPFVNAVSGNLVVGGTNNALFPPAALSRHFNPDQIGGGITVNRGGVLDLLNFDEYCGGVTLNGGADIQTGTGTLYLANDGANVLVNLGDFGGQSVISGRIGLFPGTHRFTVSQRLALGPPELDIPATLVQFTADAHLVKDGYGAMRLGTSNSFTGTMTIESGQLVISNAAALGSKTAGTFVNGFGSLALDGGLFVQEETLTLNSTNPAALVSLGNFSNTWVAPVTLQRTAGINVAGAGGALNIYSYFDCCGGSFIGGLGGLTKTGPGKLLLAGFYNSGYDGPTTVSGGTLEASRFQGGSVRGEVVVDGIGSVLNTFMLNAFASSSQLSSTGRVTLRNGGVWNLGPTNAESIPALLGDGIVNLSSEAVLAVNTGLSNEFAGSFSGPGFLNKQGTGSLTLRGNSPSFTGRTTVETGSLIVHGSMPGSPVVVRNGGSLRGSGTLGATGMDPLSTMEPEPGTPLALGAALTMSSFTKGGSSLLDLDFFGTSNDVVRVTTGGVTLSGQLSPNFRYAPREGDVLTVIDKQSAGTILGSFNGLPQNTLFTSNGIPMRISYTNGNGNDVTLTVTNLALSYAGGPVFSGNGNETVEADECLLTYVYVQSHRGVPLNITNAILRSLTSGVLVTMPSSPYPPVAANGVMFNTNPYQFRTTTNFVCGNPISFELEIGVTGEGIFAIPFQVPGSTNCARPGGGTCEGCFTVAGSFSNATLTTTRPLDFSGVPSLCTPLKPCPQTNLTDGPAVRYVSYAFTNSATNEVCVTVRMSVDCPNPLGVVAYLGTNDALNPCVNYLGDSSPVHGSAFSFRVPASTNFIINIVARTTNLVCGTHTLEVFGLPCPLPRLQIAKDTAPGKVRVNWSTAYPGWNLQQVGQLPGAFSNAPVAPVIVGSRYVQTNAAAGSNQFYRLTR